MIFIRYASIQLLAYGIDAGLFLIALQSETSALILANIVAKLFAGIFAFIAHRIFTFRVNESIAIKHQIVRYFSLLALNIPIASAILALLLICISEPIVAKFIADVVCVALSYLLSKHFIFVEPQSDVTLKNNAGVEL